MSQLILNENSSTPSTPSAGKVKVYVDNTALPQIKMVDDNGVVTQVLDATNTATVSNKTFVVPALGNATATSITMAGTIFAKSIQCSSATTIVGYVAGSGGTATQGTSKATAVTMSPTGCRSGQITVNGAALGAATIVSFVVNNTSTFTNDIVQIQHDSVGTLGAYTISANTIVNATSFQITIRNNTAGSLSEAIVLKFNMFGASTT